ncbi:spondin domain-containing protein [Marinicella sp. S1101]|uniref:spondin domain-containing protein n=1 Tax=Marinicella marina TaxID=2996016 RepID=UPI002260E1B4|nr:spondin domain-containing protein [Marinicella marina]MCX7554501.1 spondin domain-containing protein [Marinicella marina]MDJ1140652.1 spondin domain-containing protein [Marinicella marina]
MLTKTIILTLFLLLIQNVVAQEYAATYRVTFISEWSSESHPTDFPIGAHFSTWVGATHDSQIQIWSPDELATAGIKDVAEFGFVGTLRSEVISHINNGFAENYLIESDLGTTGMTNIEFNVSYSHAQVSLVSMIAPSPDWFVGVHGIDLLDNEVWVEEAIYDLQPYDSGTDSGTTYTSSNQITSPAEPISRITTAPLDNGVPLGALLFERLSVTGTSPDVVFISSFD